ncbi:MAG: hypothetical protein O7G87_05820 [bacterium]|nr:hypothetical protein [bacterium]
MKPLYFDIRDLFQSIRLGWSGKKIWVGFRGLVVAYAGYAILVGLAHLLDGTTLSQLWHRYGLFPGAVFGEFGVLGTCLHGLGMIFALCVFFISTSMICKINFQKIQGDDFFSSGDAWRFAKRHWAEVLLGPVAVLILFLLFVIGGILIGWLGNWIPVVGEVFFALFFIPIFFVALVAVFVAVVFVVSLLMSPAVVGSVGDGALEVVIESFSLAWSQPWRMVLYTVWLNVIAGVGVVLLGAFTMGALWLITAACGLFMGDKLADLFDLAGKYLFYKPKGWDAIIGNLPVPGSLTWSEIWAGRILGLMLVGISGILLAYWQAVYASGISLIYVILRYRKDGDNLLDRQTPGDLGHKQEAYGETETETETS